MYLHGGGIRAVSEPIFADRSLHRHFAGPEESTGKRMPRHKEHLKDDDGEPKVIVVWGSHNPLIGANILKLRRLMRRCADFAVPPRAIYRYLIRITVNQTDCRFTADKQVTVVHVANDVPALVNNRKCSRRVRGTPDQELPTSGWEFL